VHLSSIDGKLRVVNKTTTRSPIVVITAIKRGVEKSTLLKRFSIGHDMSVQFSRGDFMKIIIRDTLYFKLTS
jgi:hypothetical protein